MDNLKINLCCGKDYRDGYINVDFVDIASDLSKIKIDLSYDARKRLPWEDNSVKEILFYESLEHFNRWDGLKILKEIYRILQNDGVLKLSVPPAERQMKILLNQFNKKITMDDFYKAHEIFSPIKFLDDLVGATHETLIDGKDLGQGDSHKMFYSKEWIKMIIQFIGFKIESIDNEINLTARK